MNVYRLDPLLDVCAHLAWDTPEDAQRIEVPLGYTYGSRWPGARIKVINRHKPVTDCPSYLTGYPVVSHRAAEALRAVVGSDAEFLPLECEHGDFVFMNVTRVIDALDVGRSSIEWFHGSKSRIKLINRYEFQSDVLREAAAFKIPQDIEVFVKDDFRRAVQEAELTGFEFLHVWPNGDPVR